MTQVTWRVLHSLDTRFSNREKIYVVNVELKNHKHSYSLNFPLYETNPDIAKDFICAAIRVLRKEMAMVCGDLWPYPEDRYI